MKLTVHLQKYKVLLLEAMQERQVTIGEQTFKLAGTVSCSCNTKSN